MKSLSAAEAIVAEVLRTAERHDAQAVKLVKVSLGELSGINIRSFASWFRTLSIGSAAENAQLVIDKEPGLIRCICGYEGQPDNVFGENDKLTIECGKCKSTFVTPMAGTDYCVKELSFGKA